MAFSQSFNLGDSTFMNLDNEANRALNGNNQQKALEVIDESPTNSKGKLVKSRSKNCTQYSLKRKKRLQKSKSDSILNCNSNFGHDHHEEPSKMDNLSDFFKSDFSFRDKEGIKTVKNQSESSFISASKIESICKRAEEAKNLVEPKETKDDLADLFDDSAGFSELLSKSKPVDTIQQEENMMEDHIFSEDLVNLILENSFDSKKYEETETRVDMKPSAPTQHISTHFEECVNIDDSSFLFIQDEEDKQVMEKELERSKNEIRKALRCTSSALRPTPTDLSKCSESVLVLSESQPPDEGRQVPSPSCQSDNYKVIQNLEDLKKISAWGLPTSVLNEYDRKGIIQMFDWQTECLSNPKVLFEHRNLVYSAPTSAGKTLVSELLMVKTVLERSKKVLMILPFISVVREKMYYLQDLLTPSGYRVEGFFGGYSPPGGFDSINVAICTIEKANSIVNKLMEQGKLDDIGIVVVDEIHLISDPGRGYILELLLAKILYMSNKYGLQIQVVTMSATLANVELLRKWLDAELYITNFRPVELREMIKIGKKIYDNQFNFVRELSEKDFDALSDQDHVSQLCIETISEGCSVVVFCPSKDWCENLAMQLAQAIHIICKGTSEVAAKLKGAIKKESLDEVKTQLKGIPTGLDSVLGKTVSYGCAFHHAGLTSEERDIIEASFKSGSLKIIVATSTLSSGVNLPARRVIIRSPLFAGKQMSSLTYKQMIGRAGRTGKDALGESILICTENNAKTGKDLITADLKPITSCLEQENSTHLKRALLEVISSGVVSTKSDVQSFIKCTLLNAQKSMEEKEPEKEAEQMEKIILSVIEFLVEYEFIRLQLNEDSNEMNYVATRLGLACLASSMPPSDGLILFAELQKARRWFVLESELHAVYLVTPYSVCYQMQDLDWLLYLDLWEKLTPAMKKVGELVGVKESFLVRAMRGQTKLDYKALQVHKRFYTALALQELVDETPINTVADKYKCTRGLLQSLQQMASTFAGIVTAVCNSLNFATLSLVVAQFKERLFFGVHRDLIDLMRLPEMNYKKARGLFESGIENLVDLANSDPFTVEKILHNCLSFDSAKKHENEDEYEAGMRNLERNLYITGKAGVSVKDAAKLLVEDARRFVQYEIGVKGINWETNKENRGSEKRKSDSGIDGGSPPKMAKIEKKATKVVNNENTERDQADSRIVPKMSTKELREGNGQSNIKESSAPSSAVQKNRESGKKTEQPTSATRDYNGIERKINVAKVEDKNEKADQAQQMSLLEKKPEKDVLSKAKGAPQVASRPSTRNSMNKSINRIDSVLDRQNPNTKVVCRRSPRNHAKNKPSGIEPSWSKRKSTEPQDPVVRPTEDIFTNFAMDDSSFEMNSAIVDVMDKANLPAPPACDSPKAPDKSTDEIACSQDIQVEAVTQCSRLLRSYRSKKIEQTLRQQAQQEKKDDTNIEVSNVSEPNSLIQNPIHLNASHIMSTSKMEADSISFDRIEILDICGNMLLYKNALKEIFEAKSFGFAVSVEKELSKRKPLIGGNLLINQIGTESNGEVKKFALDDETYVAGVSFAISENVAFFLNLQEEGTCKGLTSDMKVETIRRFVKNSEHVLKMFDAKEQLLALSKAIPSIGEVNAKIEDPKVANWLLQPDRNLNLQDLAHQFAPECQGLTKLIGKNRGYSSVALDYNIGISAKVRSSIESCVTVHVLRGQIENLERIGTGQLFKFFNELEMPIQKSLYQMENFGFPSNEDALRCLFQTMVDTMKKLELKIYELHGSRFNLASSSAVARVLGLHKKANGRYSTSKQILEKIDSPISQLILNYRKLSVTVAKTLQPLLKVVTKNRIYGRSVTFTSTGRISMQEPNVQNIAKDFDVEVSASERKTISFRSAFFPPDGKCLVSSDFCQLEMRILAHLSQDRSLLDVMKSEKDVFTAVASKWNKIPEDAVSEQLRNGTKQICYGIIYGMGMKSLSEALRCTEQEATMLSEQFHLAYPGIRMYIQKVIKFAKQNGYVETITGRRRYLDHINSGEPQLRSQAERQAVNTTIQGSAADIAKSAILRVEKNINKYRDKLAIDSTPENSIHLVLHLHDELIYEVPEDKALKVAKVLSVTMENCVRLNVPLRVKLKIGKSWGELLEIRV